jgi:glycosyltransferase involved in cell wall biosynthesis
MRLLQQAGQLDAVSLTPPTHGTDKNADLVWQREFSIGVCENAKNPAEPSSRRPLLQALRLVLTPWHRQWSAWLSFLMQYGHSAPRGSRSLRLLIRLLQLQHFVAGTLCSAPPVATGSFLRLWQHLRSLVLPTISQQHYDLFWVENTVCWPVAADLLKRLRLRPRLIVLNGHNIEYRLLQQQSAAVSPGYYRQFLMNESRLMRGLEQSAFRQADLVLQCSDEDVLEVRGLAPRTQAVVFPNGVDTARFPVQPEARQDTVPTVLFPGSFDYLPNREGAGWLLSNIWPLVLQRIPSARLIIAGRAADTVGFADSRLASSVELAANVADMSAVFARCWVTAVPLLSGGGTRLKILEALSSGRAVVSTALGAEGVPYVDGAHLLLANNPEAFADGLCRLLTAPEDRRQLASCGADFVRTRYDWNELSARLLPVLHEALQRRTD